jgi:lathosterol oxidase
MLYQFFSQEKAIEVLFLIAFPYLLFTTIAFGAFYLWRNRKYWNMKIQRYWPKKSHIAREIMLSLLTMVIFIAVILLINWAGNHGYTRVYPNISDRGYVYFVFSIILMLVVQDTYFYWIHRFMHWKPVFKRVHKAHHMSTNPTPFAAYAFHPAEALLQIAIIPIIAFTIPYHLFAISTFSISSLLVNIMVSHMGFEFLPKGFTSHKYFKWLNPSTHHNMHHSLPKCNYSLYLNIWDRLMKTNHPDYEETFERVVNERDEARLSKTKENLYSEEKPAA